MELSKQKKEKIFPASKLAQLSESNQNLVKDAENGNEISLYILSDNLFEGKNGFTNDNYLGVRYLKLAIKNKSIEASEKYASMLLSGDKIPKDEAKGKKKMTSLIKKGSLTACLKLGFYEKEHQPPNLVEAKKLFKKASDGGIIEAMVEYAKLCENQKCGLNLDFAEALKYFKLASDLGNPEGMFFYADYVGNGYPNLLKKDPKLAFELYKKSHVLGYENAKPYYGLSLIEGKYCTKDINKGMRLVQESAESGNPYGLSILSYMYHFDDKGVNKDPVKSAQYAKAAAEKGLRNGKNNYANALQYGEGVQINLQEAERLYREAMDEGLALSFFHYGKLIEFDGDQIGIGKNIDLAGKYYKVAADAGDDDAMCCYAYALLNSSEEEKDAKSILYYLEMGSQEGNTNCMTLMGTIYLDGYIVEKNEALGVSYFKRAADLGDQSAMNIYGEMLLNGANGVKKDIAEGKRLIYLAKQ